MQICTHRRGRSRSVNVRRPSQAIWARDLGCCERSSAMALQRCGRLQRLMRIAAPKRRRRGSHPRASQRSNRRLHAVRCSSFRTYQLASNSPQLRYLLLEIFGKRARVHCSAVLPCEFGLAPCDARPDRQCPLSSILRPPFLSGSGNHHLTLHPAGLTTAPRQSHPKNKVATITGGGSRLVARLTRAGGDADGPTWPYGIRPRLLLRKVIASISVH